MRRTVRLMIGRKATEFITSSNKFKFTVAVSASIAAASLLLIASLVSLDTQFSHVPFSRPPLRANNNYNPSCVSRLKNSHRRSTSPLQPSPYLHHKLRQYEILHSRCGPLSESFNSSDCKYVVYVPFRGLGNRILALASTFLYALLTNRVLLVDFGPDMKHLFCEPFPNSTWLLPETFPLRDQFYKSIFRDAYSYGNLLKQRESQQRQQNVSNSANSTVPSLVQLYLVDDYNDYDKLFFRDENQGFLQGVPWLILISTGYFVPPIFQMQSYRSELERLFPDDDDVETVFHHLGNYLFNPSDQAWRIISGFYEAHLAKAEERIGFQVRVFEPKNTPPPLVMKQILSCTENQKILLASSSSSKAILIASLSSKFYEDMKFKYEGNSGIGVYRASHEKKQRFGDDSHNMKAWVDMYLLSMSDVLVTSSMSTFGYVAGGLGGIRPWIVMFPSRFVKNETELPKPACERAVNIEPCLHVPPWFAYPDQPGTVGPVIRCEDVPWGLKLAAGHYNRTSR